MIRYQHLLKHYHSTKAALESLPNLKQSKKDPSKKFHIPYDNTILKENSKTLNYNAHFIIHRIKKYPPIIR